MPRYYTRVCNFYYGTHSKSLVKKKKSLSLNGRKEISFDHIEIISRKFKKKISINEINNLSYLKRKKIKKDLKTIIAPKKFKNLKFNSIPKIMGIS